MIVSAVMLSGALSREFIPGIPARLADGADERAISVGISTALFGWPGLRQIAGGTNLILCCDQMMIATQHPYRVSSPRAVQRFEQAHKEAPALRVRLGLASGGSAHR
jgi:hypothetical protein